MAPRSKISPWVAGWKYSRAEVTQQVGDAPAVHARMRRLSRRGLPRWMCFWARGVPDIFGFADRKPMQFHALGGEYAKHRANFYAQLIYKIDGHPTLALHFIAHKFLYVLFRSGPGRGLRDGQ